MQRRAILECERFVYHSGNRRRGSWVSCAEFRWPSGSPWLWLPQAATGQWPGGFAERDNRRSLAVRGSGVLANAIQATRPLQHSRPPQALPRPPLLPLQRPIVRSGKADLYRSCRHQGAAAVAQRHQYQERQSGRRRLPGIDISGGGGQPGDDSGGRLRAGRGGSRGARRPSEGQGAAGHALYLDHLPQRLGGGDSRAGEQPARRQETIGERRRGRDHRAGRRTRDGTRPKWRRSRFQPAARWARSAAWQLGIRWREALLASAPDLAAMGMVSLFTRGADVNIESGTQVEMVLQRPLHSGGGESCRRGAAGIAPALVPAANQPKPLDKPNRARRSLPAGRARLRVMKSEMI